MPIPPPLPPSQPQGDDGIASIIPYRNAPALFAYYCGVFSLIPCIGALLGIAAIILGIVGLRKSAEHPEAKGKVHAWAGIVLGTLVIILHAAAIGVIVLKDR